MKRITRNRRLTAEEASKYKAIREQVAGELPDLIAHHDGAWRCAARWKNCSCN